MNSLSWFLYSADVIPSIGVMFALVGSSITTACLLIGLFLRMDDQPIPVKSTAIALSCAFVLFLIAALIPSKNTLYAIAASELGEQAYKSEIGQKASKAIEAWIDSQLSKASK